ncbi:FIST N-terminal domain-containing protein [Acuticoccus sp. I52.16.1]|uniref:FIST N-terminal domain-containing protein n=1 Tax=Acuticoccus sp. I52.16.1 TaxID=2928472 RepID=UPI001FD1FE38|nr:FIST N-terminal domain-containing protein [Acuticoccus sp. I52.16.1]UOM34450.1 FIST C-terminal domain-containing protein [Acuticoccus sp. I52.16.1]
MARLKTGLGPGPFALIALFVSPRADFARVVADARAAFEAAEVIACTTAGEIADDGYTDGTIVAVGFPSANFAARVVVVPDLSDFSHPALIDRVTTTRAELAREHARFTEEFAFLMVDGLSRMEDQLTATLAMGLGSTPVFGGSAGDGADFRKTLVSAGGRTLRNAAVVALVRTSCRVKVFKTDHLRPTEKRMVVTEADPERRLVREINAEPAAREYARILGKDPEQLTTFTFAAHPVVVRMGGQHYVRAIQKVTETGELIFFCAIDQGLVLTLADAKPMVEHLAGELGILAAEGRPDIILAADCVLRRKEAEEKQLVGAISSLLAEHGVVGFSTYGEQVNGLHVNQTLTGVAIYPPVPT